MRRENRRARKQAKIALKLSKAALKLLGKKGQLKTSITLGNEKEATIAAKKVTLKRG